MQFWFPKPAFQFIQGEAIHIMNVIVAVLIFSWFDSPQCMWPGVQFNDYVVPEEVKAAGFNICADELGSIVEGHDLKKLKLHGGVTGIAEKLCTSTTAGLETRTDLLRRREEIFGINKFTESEARSFWVFVWEAFQDMTLMILGVCAFVSLIVGLAMEGWPEGAHEGLGIVASILIGCIRHSNK